MTADPERKKQTQRLCACGDRADHLCGKVDCYEADKLLNMWLKNCALFIGWVLTFLAGLLIGGCR